MAKIFDFDFYKLVGFLAAMELVSAIAFYNFNLQIIATVAIFVIALFLSLKKLEWGIYLVLMELVIGGLGYLFALPIGDTRISVRLLLFTAVMLAWLIGLIKNHDWSWLKSEKFLALLPLFGFLVWGLIQALAYHRGLGEIFTDANNYLFLALIAPILTAKIEVDKVIKVILAGSVVVALKTALVLFLFAHGFAVLHDPFYKLIRDTGIGEIALIQVPLYRIFFQSHFYNLIALIVAVAFLAAGQIQKGDKWPLIAVIWLNFLTLLISESRTFWLAGLGGLAVIAIYSFYKKIGYKKILAMVGLLAVCLVTGHFVLNLLIGDFRINLFYSRLNEGNAEAGVSSRGAQFWPALAEIKKAPLLGWGFNKTITFNSSDPRIKNAANPTGLRTTDALELGYLDIILKIGLLGCLAYVGYLLLILFKLYKKTASDPKYLGLSVGLLVLMAVHALTPYLNHPLGIGYLLILVGLLA